MTTENLPYHRGNLLPRIQVICSSRVGTGFEDLHTCAETCQLASLFSYVWIHFVKTEWLRRTKKGSGITMVEVSIIWFSWWRCTESREAWSNLLSRWGMKWDPRMMNIQRLPPSECWTQTSASVTQPRTLILKNCLKKHYKRNTVARTLRVQLENHNMFGLSMSFIAGVDNLLVKK